MRLYELAPYYKTLKITPVLLGAVFQAVGTANTPIATMNEKQRKYSFKDLNDFAQANKLGYQMNSNFPIRTIIPLRVYLINPRTIDCLFRSAWQHNINISDNEVLKKNIK